MQAIRYVAQVTGRRQVGVLVCAVDLPQKVRTHPRVEDAEDKGKEEADMDLGTAQSNDLYAACGAGRVSPI